MTFFLKSKIKKSRREIQRLERKLLKEASKYNALVNEYQLENSMPSFIGQQPQQNNNSIPDEIPPLKIRSVPTQSEDLNI